jgi:hypothetical protein
MEKKMKYLTTLCLLSTVTAAHAIDTQVSTSPDLQSAWVACQQHIKYRISPEGRPTADPDGYAAGWERCSDVKAAWENDRKVRIEQDQKDTINRALQQIGK